MFTEILRIRPILDKGAAAATERQLSLRFSRVAKRFGSAMKNAMKGTAFGIGIGMLAKLLNPLEDLEKRIRDLIGDGADLGTMAERMGSSAGELKRAQVVAQSVGLSKDDFQAMATAFAEAVETAQREGATPGGVQSAGANMVKNFVMDDKLQGFENFLQALRAASPEARAGAEAAVFGSQQYGGQRRFIDADMTAQAARLGLPGREAMGEASSKLANLELVQSQIRATNEAMDWFQSAKMTTENMVKVLEARDARDAEKLRQQFKNFDSLAKGSEALDEIINLLKQGQTAVIKGVGMLSDLVLALKRSPFLRNYFKKEER